MVLREPFSRDPMSVSILIVEDHDLLAQSLKLALRGDGFEAELADDLTADGILKIADRMRPSVVLLDLDLGADVGTSLPLIPGLRALGASVVMVTAAESRARLGECIDAGALGIVAKSAGFDDLLGAIRDACEMRTLLSKPERDELLDEMRRQHAADRERDERFDRLTARERQVLAALCDGKSADMIASEAFVSVATVRTQIRALLQKLGVKSQIAAVAMARRASWGPR